MKSLILFALFASSLAHSFEFDRVRNKDMFEDDNKKYTIYYEAMMAAPSIDNVETMIAQECGGADKWLALAYEDGSMTLKVGKAKSKVYFGKYGKSQILYRCISNPKLAEFQKLAEILQ